MMWIKNWYRADVRAAYSTGWNVGFLLAVLFCCIIFVLLLTCLK